VEALYVLTFLVTFLLNIKSENGVKKHFGYSLLCIDKEYIIHMVLGLALGFRTVAFKLGLTTLMGFVCHF